MPITQQGALNTTALVVPDLYIQIVPPQFLLNGVPSNLLGIVGSATWGPVNSPTLFGSPAQGAQYFGQMQPRKYDLMTAVSVAALQGASSFYGVRVTDGTDTAASVALEGCTAAAVGTGGTGYAVNDTITLTNGVVLKVATISTGAVATVTVQTPGLYTAPTGPVAQASTSGSGTGATFTLTSAAVITFTSKYTGSLANSDVVTVSAGSNSTQTTPTWKVVLSRPGQVPETFDNIGGTGNAVYTNIATAVNNGQSGLRGPSNLMVATAQAGTTAPAAGGFTLSGGTDGTTTITGTVLLGVDTSPRTGMYALRGSKCSVAMLADCDSSTTWSTQVAYGLSEGTYMILTGPAGDTISNAVSTKQTAGIDSYAAKLLFGDWVYFNDTVNNQPARLVSPQGFVAGALANLSPEQSSLNKRLQGIVGTQKTAANQIYSGADLQALGQAGIDVIANPAPGGTYFAARFGRNSSSNPVVHGDNYTRLTNYIAATLEAGVGIYVGQLQTPQEQHDAKATLDSFFAGMMQQRMITDWKVTLDSSNNPADRVALGYQQADIQVRYGSVVEYFLANVTGGQSVTITRANTQLAA